MAKENYSPRPAGAKKCSTYPLSLPSGKRLISKPGKEKLYMTTLVGPGRVIPAKAGIQKDAGFQVKPGMTISGKFMSLCI